MNFKKPLRPFLTIILLLSSGPAFCQLPVMQFETITTRDGLPTTTILSAVQDRSGFMWFGTRLCPIRYDGASFRVFNTPETNLVSGIAVDRENDIWFASDPNGIGKIDSRDLKLRRFLTDIKNSETGYFYIDRNNRGWYSDFHGVNRVDLETNSRKHYPLRQTTYFWAKASFVEDQAGTLWVVGRDNGLFRYDPAKDALICEWGPDSEDPSRKEDVVLSKACADSDGFLWIATISHGLIRYDPRSRTAKKYYAGRDNPSMFSVATGVDENGKPILWIGHQDGLGIFRPEQEKFYYFSNIFPVDFEVHDIYRDVKDGVVWVCTSEGIAKYHPKSNFFQTISLPPGIAGASVGVNAVIQDKFADSEVYYLGLSHTGMVKWERSANTFTLIPYPGGEEAETNWMIQRDDNTIWIGANRWDQERPGIFIYDLITQKFVTNSVADLANQKFSVPFFKYASVYGEKKVMIGNSDEGIFLFNGGKDITPWSEAKQKDLLKNNNMVTDVLFTKSGKMLLGTVGGLVHADELRSDFTSMDGNIPDSIPWRSVNSLFEDSKGNIWAARWGCLTQTSPDGKLLNLFTTSDGFHDQECSGVVEDATGNIWMGNFEGLYCINPVTRRIIRFTVSDGLISNNTKRRLFMSNDKERLFVGHKNGFNIVKVSKLVNTAQPPLLAVSALKVHEKVKDVDMSKLITLDPDENSFSVDFIALNYRKEQDNQYAYYLEGFEEDWNYSGTNHLAYYTNLSPGHYTLHAKAGDTFGNWSKQTLQMRIHVTPAFYETWWFRIATLAAILTLLYVAYRFRVNQLLRLQRVRNRISADLHDEFGASLSSISIMGTLAQKGLSDQHPATQFVDRMVEEARQMSGSLDDIIWNISARNDSLASMIARMRRYASEVFEAKRIVHSLSMPEDLEELTLSMEQRRDLYLIFKESVNNIVKHSHCSRASVTVTVIQKDLVLQIQDDGVGYDPASHTNRNGLVNLRERARNLKGRLDIESGPGKGTSIKLVFPLRAHHPKGLLKQ